MKEGFRSKQRGIKRVDEQESRRGTCHPCKSYLPWLLVLTLAALLMPLGFHSGPASAQSRKQRLEQDVGQVFTNHEDLRLDTRAISQDVRESGHLSLRTVAYDFEIELTPNDLRSPKYVAEEALAGGVEHELQRTGINTYKGYVDSVTGTDARFTLDDNKIEGMIITPQEQYFLESARKYSAAADEADYLLYKTSDLRPDITRTCGDTLDEKVTLGAQQFASSSSFDATPQVFSPFKVAEIATEADFEYVSALGGSTQANNDILSIMNQIQGIYERDIGLTFTVVFQHTWSTADPYSTTGPSQPAANLLNSFTNYWNANFTNVNRDVAHLWTGKNLGGPNGVAWQAVVCLDPAAAYGLSDLETIAPFRVGIPAHEIGHNFGATHCDGQAGCDNTIMVTIQNQSNTLTFCQFSKDEITNYVNANSGCLSLATAAPVVQFRAASYIVSEASPRVDITVDRSGDTAPAVSVGFVTNDAAGLQNCNVFNGTASPRCDYANVIGTLQFAAGETSKSFSIPIVDDSYADGNETFTVSLNNVSGAFLGTPFTTTVIITDNEVANGPNPIDTTDFFVRQHYIDFLGREPDPPGFAGWTSEINNCAPGDTSCDRVHVSSLFYQSAEFQQRGYFVYRFYPVSFGRKPDYAEFTVDLARVSGFLDATQLEAAKVAFIADFMARPAFANTYNGLNNQQYVDALLQTAGVMLSSRPTMIAGLNDGTLTRAQVLRQISESTEVSQKYFNQAFVVMEYFGYLRRDPDSAYLAWIATLDQTGDSRVMVTGFVNSLEYRQRFGP